MRKEKNDSKDNVIVFILYLFLSLIIPKKKEIIIDNNKKQTNASNFDNFDKEETLQKIITLLLLKGTSSSKYSGSKADLNIVGVRVLLVYAMTYILSLIITSLIAQKYYNEEIKIKEDIRETIGSTLIGLATLAGILFLLIVIVIKMESNREYLAFNGVFFGSIAYIIIRKITS